MAKTKVKNRKKKTHKAISSRVRTTKKGKKGGKLKMRKAGHGHFKARQTGKKKRNIRADKEVSPGDLKNIKRLI